MYILCLKVKIKQLKGIICPVNGLEGNKLEWGMLEGGQAQALEEWVNVKQEVKNLRLRFRLVLICNASLYAPAQVNNLRLRFSLVLINEK